MSSQPRGSGRGGRGGQASQSSSSSFKGGASGGGSSYAGSGAGRKEVPITVFNPGYRAVKDVAWSQKEDELLKGRGKDDSLVLPRRPAYGTLGKELLVWTNYFRLDIGDIVLYRHAIKVQRGDKDAPKGRVFRLVQLLINGPLKSIGIDAVSDFGSTLITRQPIKEGETFSVVYIPEGQTDPEDGAPEYQIRLQPTGTLNMSELINFTTSTSTVMSEGRDLDLVQALNIIIGHASRTNPNTVTVGRTTRASMRVQQDQLSLGGGLEVLRAFVFSARAATERILLNVQVKNLPFLVAKPLHELVTQFKNAGGVLNSLAPFLHLVRVETIHIQHHGKNGKLVPRYKTILGLADVRDGRSLKNPPRVKANGAGPRDVHFWYDGPSLAKGYTSVYDFFQTVHKRNINPHMPVVNVGTTADPQYLPMEVCRVRPGQVAKAKITSQQTSDMIKFAVRQPSENAKAITTVGLSLLELETGTLPGFDVKAQPQLVAVPGRYLPAPQLTFGNTKPMNLSKGKWDMRDKKLYKASSMTRWHCLYICESEGLWKEPEHMMVCLDRFVEALKSIGMACSSPTKANIWRQKVTPEDVTKPILKRLKEIARRDPQFLLVIIPTKNNVAIYNAVKYGCDVEEGMLSQCVLDTKVTKLSGHAQYFVNVGLKINLKLGGVNQYVEANHFGQIHPSKTMFVGLDVTHPSPGSVSTAPSVASIVSSIDGNLAQWPAAIRVQEGKKEMITDLELLFKGQLQYWKAVNKGNLPQNIILYRDGVSEGQYQTVLDEELPAIRKATEATYQVTDTKRGIPKISIIIVGKRHHTRFYPTDGEDSDKMTGNARNGLVVDRGVTNFCHWDFFLQAHSPMHGTARPAHYYVIYDQVFRGLYPHGSGTPTAADTLERVTHALCYLFGRSTSAVSLCPPAYYADLVCERARRYLASQFAPVASTAASEGGSSAGAAGPAHVANQVQLHANIEKKMFYI